MPAFDLAITNLDEVAAVLCAAVHADEDPVEDPLFRFGELVLGHITNYPESFIKVP